MPTLSAQRVCTSWPKSIISCVCQRVLNTDTYMKINNCTKIYVASVLKCFGFGGGVIRMKLQLKTNTLIWNTASLNSLRGEGWHPINGVNTTTFMCLSQPKTWISKVICRGLTYTWNYTFWSWCAYLYMAKGFSGDCCSLCQGIAALFCFCFIYLLVSRLFVYANLTPIILF
jgi:hypothetical protein